MLLIIVAGIIVFCGVEIILFLRYRERFSHQDRQWAEKIAALEAQEKELSDNIKNLERDEVIKFLFYELARKMAPILNREEVFAVFSEEIKHLGRIDAVSFSSSLEAENYFEFSLGKYKNKEQFVSVASSSKKVAEFLPVFVKLLKLCLDRIKLYEKIQQLSIYDSLTHTYNRRYFMYRFSEEFERAKKFKLDLSVLMMDIDYFKNVNDSYGHLVGDIVLRQIAAVIGKGVRSIDFVGRLGGEEFCMILLDTKRNGAILVAERICSKIRRKKIKAFDEQLSVTVSIGVATFPYNTLHSDVLLETADKALYKAKVSGRNKVCWF